MKIKYILLLIVLWNVGLVSGQSTNSSPTNNNIALPNFTPPSPHSFEMTKYGDIPVNEFTGMINATIPLYEYKAGNLSLPISLEYSGSGVKVDQSNTWTGINWVLRSGGVITRTINDVADELAGQSNRIILNSIPLNSGEDGSQEANDLVNIIENNSKDSEADIFSFNFNGYSGSFFLDNDFQPTLIKNDKELKITIVGTLLNNQEFIITTPDGVRYYFGGINAIETESGTSANPCSSCGRATAYYLTKIEHPINGTILFEYDSVVGALNSIAKSRNYGVMTFSTQINDDCGPPPLAPEKTEEIVITTKQAGTKYVKKIYSSDTPIYVDFISENKNLGNSHKILNKINIVNNTTITKEFNFEYLGANQNSSYSKRFFLTKVSINKDISTVNGLQNEYEEYNMVYDDPEGLPDRLSYAQDYYGYYNGIEDNISSLPQLNVNVFNNSSYNFLAADRKPNFQYAKKGTLKQIIYPTRGFTEFEYEAIPVKEKVFTHYRANASLSSTGADLTNNYVPRYDEDLEHAYNLGPIFQDQYVDIKITFSADENCALPNHNIATRLIVEDLTNSNNSLIFNQSRGYQGGEIIVPQVLFHQGDQYRVSIIFPNVTSSNCTSSPLNVSFDFDLFTSYRVVDGRGIRIKRVIDKTSPDATAMLKRYYYVPVNKVSTYLNPENVPFESVNRMITYGMVNYRAKHKASSADDAFCILNWWTDQAYYTYINSSAVQNSFSATDGIVYPFVTISYGGDNFENGGTQKYFNKIVSDFGNELVAQSTSQYPTSILANRFYNKLNNENVISGDLIQEIDFEKRGGHYYKKKQKDYNYESINQILNKSYVNIVGRKVYEVLEFYGVNDPMMISSNYYMKAYLTKSFNTKLNSTTQSDYFSLCEIPDYDYNFYGLEQELLFSISDYQDPSNVRKIVTTQNISYGNLRGLPTETRTSTSDDSRELITKNYYPTDASSLSGLTTDQLNACATLVNQNRLATPIQVENYENHDLLSTQRTLYKAWNGNTQQVLPEIIQASKGDNPLEDRAVFSECDANGNPTVVSLKDGTKTKYFYNALNQVVAKVENYSASLNIPAQPNLSSACTFITQYPQAQISVYNYDATTHQIVSIVAPNCKTMYYVYNALHQLQAIKDNDGNILQEFEHNYKPQN